MRNTILHVLAAVVVLGACAAVSSAADYKSTLEEHWLRMLSGEESLDFGYIHPTLDAAGAVDGKRHENCITTRRKSRLASATTRGKGTSVSSFTKPSSMGPAPVGVPRDAVLRELGLDASGPGSRHDDAAINFLEVPKAAIEPTTNIVHAATSIGLVQQHNTSSRYCDPFPGNVVNRIARPEARFREFGVKSHL